MEILKSDRYSEYEKFVSEYGESFMQSVRWSKIKTAWQHEVVVSRDEKGQIVGGLLVLIRTISPGMTLLYSPRGPVCDIYDRDVWEDLLNGVKLLAKRHNAFMFKTDPLVLENDEKFISMLFSLGFSHIPRAREYDTIQRRYNYLLDIGGKSEEEILMSFKSKCRYHIRLSQRHGTECKIVGKEGLDDFMRLYEKTGERKHFPVRSKEYCERLLDTYGDDMSIILCTYKDETISGMLLCTYAGRASYIFGASSEQYRNVMPNYLMQWEAIKYARYRGCSVYDFMAVPVELDEKSPMYGVYQFKSGFSGKVAPYAGEFDYIFSPAKSALFNSMMKLKRVVNKIQLKAP